MDHSITQMYLNGFIDREEAITKATNPGKMDKILPPISEVQRDELRLNKPTKQTCALEEVLSS